MKKIYLLTAAALFIILGARQVTGQTSFKMLNYLYSISGNHTIAGQQGSGYMDGVATAAGRYPGLWGEDFSFTIDSYFGGSTMADFRSRLAAEAKQRWGRGEVIALMFHACPPTMGEPCNFDGDVKSHLSDEQWNDLITPGTQLYNNWLARLDAIVPALLDLKNNGVEVLWRPLHEMNQGAFWWAGRKGPNGSLKLYQITHDYLVKTKGLTNLIWVWNLQDFGTLATDVNDYDPGSNYWDVFALDVYWSDQTGLTTTKYNIMTNKAGSKPIAIGECDAMPSADALASQPRWTYFMGWRELTRQKNSDAYISSVYNAANVITRDELPGWGTSENSITLPATIEAENYTSMSGVQTETTSDTGGGQDVGYIETGDWLSYHVTVPATGIYTVQYRIASQNGGGSIRLEKLGGGTTYGTLNVPSTGGWQTWQTISHTVTLTAGTQDIAITAVTGGFNINWFSITAVVPTNLAKGKPVSVTSTEAGTNIASNGVDGDTNTRWSSSYADNQNYVVDLGASYNINRVVIRWEAAYATQFQIQTSADNATWTTVYSNYSATGGTMDLSITGTGRYIKMYGIKRATTYGFSFWEFEVYGTAAKGAVTTAAIATGNVSGVSVFPNPATNQLTINTGVQDGVSDIEVITLEGRSVYKVQIEGATGSVSVGDIKTKGFVFVKISNANAVSTRKVFLK